MGLYCLGSWLLDDKDSWDLWVLVTVRNGKVELGQIATAFSRAVLDPLNAPQVCTPAPWVFTLSAQLRKPHKVDLEG